jgi:hypothetical protein
MALLTYYYTNFLINVEMDDAGFFTGDSDQVTTRVFILLLSFYLGTIELIQAVTVPFKTYIRSVSNLNYVFMLLLNLIIVTQHSQNNWA